jgi:hypothetical protein
METRPLVIEGAVRSENVTHFMSYVGEIVYQRLDRLIEEDYRLCPEEAVGAKFQMREAGFGNSIKKLYRIISENRNPVEKIILLFNGQVESSVRKARSDLSADTNVVRRIAGDYRMWLLVYFSMQLRIGSFTNDVAEVARFYERTSRALVAVIEHYSRSVYKDILEELIGVENRESLDFFVNPRNYLPPNHISRKVVVVKNHILQRKTPFINTEGEQYWQK